MERSAKGAFVTVLAALVATMPVLAADSPKPRSQVFSGETLRMPHFLKHPLIFQLSPTDRVTIYRTPKDTCGLYTWGVFTVSNGGGPVPHIHYADKEWFLTENQGGIRVFLPKDPLPALVPGQVPGLNGPSQAMGSTLLPNHAALFSRPGIVHYYTNESGERLSGFHNVWAPGYGMIGVFQVFDQAVKRGQPLDPLVQIGLLGFELLHGHHVGVLRRGPFKEAFACRRADAIEVERYDTQATTEMVHKANVQKD
jgi:hypothetical protein